MAYYDNVDENEEENPAQGMNKPQQNQSEAPIQRSSQPSTGSTGASSVPNQQAAPRSTQAASSGASPGFQNYAKANQGNAQSKLNETVTKNVSNMGQSATKSIDNASEQFSQRADQGALGGAANRSTVLADAQGAVTAARNAGAVEQPQQDRFKEAINARYAGPESIRQTEAYNSAAEKAKTAQTAIDNSKTASGREDLLRQVFQGSGEYGAGLNKLDSALLNASQQGVQNLQNAAQAQGNVGQKLDQAQVGSVNLAQNLANEVRGIRDQVRTDFTSQQEAERAATEGRLDNVQQNWDALPDYFKALLSNNGQSKLTQEEADYLGVRSGQGLYNTGAGVIIPGQFNRDEQITKDEYTRQAALAQLAGLDLSNELSTTQRYVDEDLAGTKTIQDSLNLAEVQRQMAEAEKNFYTGAKGTNITARGNKDGQVEYRNTNVADALAKMGYNDGIYDNGLVNNNNLYSTLAGNEAQAYKGNSGKGYDDVRGAESWTNYHQRVAAQRAHGTAADQVNKYIQSQGFNNRINVNESGLDETRMNALANLLAQLNGTGE